MYKNQYEHLVPELIYKEMINDFSLDTNNQDIRNIKKLLENCSGDNNYEKIAKTVMHSFCTGPNTPEFVAERMGQKYIDSVIYYIKALEKYIDMLFTTVCGQAFEPVDITDLERRREQAGSCDYTYDSADEAELTLRYKKAKIEAQQITYFEL